MHKNASCRFLAALVGSCHLLSVFRVTEKLNPNFGHMFNVFRMILTSWETKAMIKSKGKCEIWCSHIISTNQASNNLQNLIILI